jgi:hypothetical protein
MRSFLLGLRHPWRAALTLIALVLCAVLFGRYLQLRANYGLCDIVEPQVINGPRGDAIEMDTRFCDPLAGDPGTIVVRHRPADERNGRIVFAYNPAAGEVDANGETEQSWYPAITWTEHGEVRISTSRISQIQRQRFSDGDVRIAYQIGKVDYP